MYAFQSMDQFFNGKLMDYLSEKQSPNTPNILKDFFNL